MKLSILKLSVLSALIFACSGISSAQLRYGFNFGGSFAEARLSDASGFSLDNQSGFRGGLVLEYQLPSSGLAFDGSVLYHRYNTRLIEHSNDARSAFGRNFIELPLNVKYKFWISSINNLAAPFIFTGPSFMFNVSSSKLTLLKQKRFQPGWNVGIGLDVINFLQLQAGYRFGIGNSLRSLAGADDASLHTSGWHLSAILLFDF